jgi:hypothetical protein
LQAICPGFEFRGKESVEGCLSDATQLAGLEVLRLERSPNPQAQDTCGLAERRLERLLLDRDKGECSREDHVAIGDQARQSSLCLHLELSQQIGPKTLPV